MSEYLQHYGVKGMRWGVRKSVKKALRKSRQRYLDKEKRHLMDDAKKVTGKAEPGKTARTYGKYAQKRNGVLHPAMHIVDEYGSVKMSYIRGLYGDRYIASSKEYVDKHIKLSDYFRSIPTNIEYDVYD